MQEVLPPFRAYGNLPRGRRQVEVHLHIHARGDMPGRIHEVQGFCHGALLCGYVIGTLVISVHCIGNGITGTACGNIHIPVIPVFLFPAVIKDSRGFHVRNGKATHFDLRGIII